MPKDIETVSNWLLGSAINPAEPEALLRDLGRKLTECGIQVDRISLGRSFMHPNIGLLDLTWESEGNSVTTDVLPRRKMRPEMIQDGPFGVFIRDLTRRSEEERSRFLAGADGHLLEIMPTIAADLEDRDVQAQFPLYRHLAERGMTGYFAYSLPFTTDLHDINGIRLGSGASVSFATARKGGFSTSDRAGLRAIALALMACVRVVSESFLTRALLEAYVGRNAATQVLSGQIALGDMREIDCVLLYSDIRGSTALSQRLAPQDYLDLLNRYFDRVAGTVQDHGGEVMKFIGDGLLAIFPISPESRTAGCDAALAAARTALARSALAQDEGLPPFGIALDAGTVYYGNVGTQTRLDFTVIGATVARASRIEALTRDLGHPILASQAFSADCSDPGTALSARPLSGFQDPVGIFAYSC